MNSGGTQLRSTVPPTAPDTVKDAAVATPKKQRLLESDTKSRGNSSLAQRVLGKSRLHLLRNDENNTRRRAESDVAAPLKDTLTSENEQRQYNSSTESKKPINEYLNDWLKKSVTLYPTFAERGRIMMETGISGVQLQTWLQKNRKRMKARAPEPFPESKEPAVLKHETVDIVILVPKSGELPELSDVVTTTRPGREILYKCKSWICYYDAQPSKRELEIDRVKREKLEYFLKLVRETNREQEDLPCPKSPRSRLKYLMSLWPKRLVLPSGRDVRDHFGFEVVLCAEDGRPERDAALHPTSAADYAFTKDSWVQCDHCEKWRRLPDHVDVALLPPKWWCGFNEWDPIRNDCSVPEETVTQPVSAQDPRHIRRRTFAKDFVKRLKYIDKAMTDLKQTGSVEENSTRQFVQCAECFKKRPLLSGMDYRKIPQPFVCWMNKWDELHASCYIPEERISDSMKRINSTSKSNAPLGKKKKRKIVEDSCEGKKEKKPKSKNRS